MSGSPVVAPEPVTPTIGTTSDKFFGPPNEPGLRCYTCAIDFDPRNPPARTVRDRLSLCFDCVWLLDWPVSRGF